MNKKLIAVAVAGVFAAPVAALAQSSVTISGMIKGGFESQSMGNLSAARPAGANKSTTGVADDSSAIVFTVLEDLGNGMQAEVRLDFRPTIDTGGSSNNSNNIVGSGNAVMNASGNTHIGLKSKQWGTFFMGRQDLHYFNTESNITDKASLRTSPVALLSYVINRTGAGTATQARAQALANATRTGNVVYYKTPDFGPFWMIVAYSSNAANAADGDIGNVGRKGRAWNLNPNFSGANWQVGYSYWQSKADAGAAALADSTATGNQRSDRLYGSYVWSGFKIGLAYDRSRVNGALTGIELNRRTTWSIPASYTWGPHSVHAVYTKAGNDKATVNAGLATSANEWAMAYAYELSKRTSVALSYARINNAANANYFLFASTSLGLDNANSSGTIGSLQGEKPSMWGVTLRHAF